MNKNELRNKYRDLRAVLTKEEVEDLSLNIANKTLKLPIWNETYYHIFLPIEDKKEVNTSFLLHVLHGKDKSVVVSKADFNSGNLTHILLQENTVIALSDHKIPEPVSGIEIPSGKLDVIFIPLLGYDLQGNRIGYGKGFYDRFLANCNSNAIFIGLSFFEPEIKIVHERRDIPLHFCVTPQKIYKF